MSKKKNSSVGREALLAEVQKTRVERDKTYRERALKMFPWICGRCEREFEGKKLKELTVHHKDHNHDNNPPDGSNWELLCIYCHENEHAREGVADWYDGLAPEEEERKPAEPLDNPFAALGGLLKENE